MLYRQINTDGFGIRCVMWKCPHTFGYLSIYPPASHYSTSLFFIICCSLVTSAPSSLIFSSSITTSFLFPLSRDWLTVCCVYFGLQGDVGLPGPSGTPGDGSLRSEQTLTIYKGDQVTQQVKGRSWGCSASTTHTHTHTLTTISHMDVVGFDHKNDIPKSTQQAVQC